MKEDIIRQRIETQKAFFATGTTRNIKFRKEMLRKLRDAIINNEKKITDAVYSDLRKSYQEAYLTEIGLVLAEIRYHLRKLPRWDRPGRVPTPLYLLPSRSKIVAEPLGASLIIAPWNYPFQLLMAPLVGAISSGCTAVLKPSPYTPETAKVIEEIITATFPSEYITVIRGGRETNQMLLNERFDIIFFTGSSALGKVVMEAASRHLTPVVLELGGKSPCIVDSDADISKAAKRIVWGKCINAGQTCIAPDYILTHISVKERLVEALKGEIARTYGDDPSKSNWYPRIVNGKAFDRIKGYIDGGNIVHGGRTIKDDLYIEPTIIDQPPVNSPVMQEEIFGPVLPILTFEKTGEAINFVNSREKPLALYYFGKNRKAQEVVDKTTSGGGCINDTLMHVTNHHLPFGGVGNSGMGSYHGKESFLAFSNRRAVVTTPTWIDLPFRYVPFKLFSAVKKVL